MFSPIDPVNGARLVGHLAPQFPKTQGPIPHGALPHDGRSLSPVAEAVLNALAAHNAPQAPKTQGTPVTRLPARVDPAALDYARRMLATLSSAGYTSEQSNPVIAWGDVSARFAQAAHQAGYANPRHYLAVLLSQHRHPNSIPE